MNREKLSKKVNESIINQINNRGYIAPVDVLLEISVLTKDNYLKWRNGQVDYLERVCHCNLSQLTFILDEINRYAFKNQLKASKTVYKGWGKNRNSLLRFSKTNNIHVENKYSTHYISKKLSKNEE